MKKLSRVVFINAAGFGYLDFPVGGHSQVFGVNGHGKTTLLRAVLFFYLGTNDKAPYGLAGTKADFVSHYLGEQPSYLLYEVERGGGEPAYHLAVTRPGGRIQFHFVDAPFRRDYYQDGRLVLTMERVSERWREARCATEQVTSYDEFHHRLYGVVPSPYAVFRPAPRSSGQTRILPQVISGIFTVSQLNADKLKSVLTCGVRKDALATELDLSLLKNHLENFRRVNRAVKTYLQHEKDAFSLVELSTIHERVIQEKKQSIEDLVSMAKCLPERSEDIGRRRAALDKNRAATKEIFDAELQDQDAAILKLEKEKAVLDGNVTKGEGTLSEYEKRGIARKAADLQKLPQLQAEKTLVGQEYLSLTTKFEDERQRKTQMLADVERMWAELSRQFERRRADGERNLRKILETLDGEKATALASIAKEESQARRATAPRHAQTRETRRNLNIAFKALSEFKEPPELALARTSLAVKKQQQQEAANRRDRLKGEVALAKVNSDRQRERLERDAQLEREQIQAAIALLETQRDRVTNELEIFDESLARYFQTEAPSAWPAAAKTITRETLFRNAKELAAEISHASETSAWGVAFTTQDIPEPAESYSRDALAIKMQETRRALHQQHDLLEAARMRCIAASDDFDKRTAQARAQAEIEIATSTNLQSAIRDEVIRIEGRIVALGDQVSRAKNDAQAELERRDLEISREEQCLHEEEENIGQVFGERRQTLEEEFRTRRKQLYDEGSAGITSVDDDEARAEKKREDEMVRIEELFQSNLIKGGVDPVLMNTLSKRASAIETEIKRIDAHRNEVIEYHRLKQEYIDPLPSLRSQLRVCLESLAAAETGRKELWTRREEEIKALDACATGLANEAAELKLDDEAAIRFRKDSRFLQEWEYFERADLAPASFYRAGAVRDAANAAELAHEKEMQIGKKGDKAARVFLNRFDPETLDRKVLGFSPIHAYFEWFVFVGSELRPFINSHGILAMKKIQTQEFEQLIRNVCAKNADFREGVRQVRQTAVLIQQRLENNNFVDVLDAVELKVERVDSRLTEILGKLEEFADISFTSDHDLFGRQADGAQIDRAIATFEQLLREIDGHRENRLFLTDYFDFSIRVRENGHDLGWRKSLDDVGSTGTDYLVKVLIYLSLIEVYRERALEAKTGSTVHCVLDETGVLAPKYIRSVLDYATKRGIILITAGHSQQTLGFENWIRVCKQGQRFTGQTVLRRVLKCA